MKCRYTDQYMDQILPSGQVPARLAGHLSHCPDCKEAVRKWRFVQREIQKIDQENTPVRQIPLEESTKKILVLAAKERNPNKTSGWHKALPIAASFLLVAGAAFYLTRSEKTPPVSTGSHQGPAQTATLIVDGDARTARIDLISDELGVPKGVPTLLQLNNDTVGIDKRSRLSIDQATPERTRLRLEHGRIACRVFHKSGAERFEIQSGPFLVRVTGTQLAVSRREHDQIEVAVWDGEVEVSRDDKHGTVIVPKGSRVTLSPAKEASFDPLSEEDQSELERLLDPRPPEDEDESPPMASDTNQGNTELAEAVAKARSRGPQEDLATWRSWILDGRYQKACRSLRQHLKSHRDDAAAWSLLSDCARKTGRWKEALAAYREIIALETGAKKQRARYRAAAIYQDHQANPAAAAKLYEQYLAEGATTSLVRAEAMLRLARAYLDMGRRRQAKSLLDDVVREHRGTTAAKKAKDMLESLKLSPVS